MATIAAVAAVAAIAGNPGLLSPGLWPGARAAFAGATSIADDAVLAKLDEAAAKITDLVADFRELKHTQLLRAPLESSGVVRLNRTKTLWITEQPQRSMMAVSDGEMRLYFPEDRLLEIYPLDEEDGALFATPLFDSKELAQHFEITVLPALAGEEDGAEVVALRLVPKAAAVRARVKSIEVVVESARGVVRRGVMTNARDERTEFFFSRHRVNSREPIVDPTRNVPEGTTISRPRGAAPVDDGEGGDDPPRRDG